MVGRNPGNQSSDFCLGNIAVRASRSPISYSLDALTDCSGCNLRTRNTIDVAAIAALNPVTTVSAGNSNGYALVSSTPKDLSIPVQGVVNDVPWNQAHEEDEYFLHSPAVSLSAELTNIAADAVEFNIYGDSDSLFGLPNAAVVGSPGLDNSTVLNYTPGLL